MSARPARPGEARRLPRLAADACRLLWRADRRVFLAAMATMLLSGLAVGPRLIGVRDLLAVMTQTPGPPSAGDFVLPLLLVSGSTIVIETAGAFRPHVERLLEAASGRIAQESILAVAQDADYADYDDPEFHDALDRATQGSELRPVQVVQGLSSLVGSGLGALTLMVAVVSSSLLVAALLLAAYLPVIAVQLRSGLRYYQMHTRMTQDDRMRGYLVRLLTNRVSVAELRFNDGDRELARRVRKAWDLRLAEIRAVTARRIWITLLSAVGAAVATVLAAVVLVWLFLRGSLTVATAGLLMVAMWELGATLAAIGWGIANLTEAGMFLDDYTRFVGLSGRPAGRGARRRRGAGRGRPPTHRLPPLSAPDTVALDRVSFHYPGSPVTVLQDVDVAVAPGEVVALVGPSGAGKSTLIKVLTGLYQPTGGVVRWAGSPVAAEHGPALRRRVSVMLQDFGRYSLSVRDNIALHDMARRDDTTAIVEVAVIAGIHDVVSALPEGYETRLGVEFDGGVDLSVGQWQRLALARALFARSDVLILDEPTSALDPETERQFIARLRAACGLRAVVIISHRFSTVTDVDRIHVLSSGRVVESGRHGELLAAGGLYWRLFSGDAPAGGPSTALGSTTDGVA